MVSYGQVAQLIGAPGCARQVSFVLSSSSKKYKLPWHRVIGSGGSISSFSGSYRQSSLLKKEGVEVEGSRVDMGLFQWKPTPSAVRKILKGLPVHKRPF